jgi:hypothetical protein
VFAEVSLDMRGAAVSDEALPPMLTGEVRLLGQKLTPTAALARSDACKAWRQGVARGERAWAQVLTPHVAEPEKVVEALRVHLGLSKGTELTAAMPLSPATCPSVEAFIIPQDAPRVGLRGQAGVRVRRELRSALPAGTVIGAYRALTLTLEEYGVGGRYKFGEQPRCALPPLGGPGGGDVAPLERELLFESFAGEYTVWNRERNDERAAASEAHAAAGAPGGPAALAARLRGIGPDLVASAFGFGNLTCLINDGVGPPGPHGVEKEWHEPGGGDANVMLVEIAVHGWPFIFVVSTHDILPGCELFMSYGGGYWEQLRQISKRLAWMRSVAAGARARVPSQSHQRSGGGDANGGGAGGGGGMPSAGSGGGAGASGGASGSASSGGEEEETEGAERGGSAVRAAAAAVVAAAAAAASAPPLPPHIAARLLSGVLSRSASGAGAPTPPPPLSQQQQQQHAAPRRGIVRTAGTAAAAAAARAKSVAFAPPPPLPAPRAQECGAARAFSREAVLRDQKDEWDRTMPPAPAPAAAAAAAAAAARDDDDAAPAAAPRAAAGQEEEEDDGGDAALLARDGAAREAAAALAAALHGCEAGGAADADAAAAAADAAAEAQAQWDAVAALATRLAACKAAALASWLSAADARHNGLDLNS